MNLTCKLKFISNGKFPPNGRTTSFKNPDHVDIVIHNYRCRLGLAEGEAKYDEMEKKLAESPSINVLAITIEGNSNGAPHTNAETYLKKITGKYSHLVLKDIGHNVPQEAPVAFSQAIIEVDGY